MGQPVVTIVPEYVVAGPSQVAVPAVGLAHEQEVVSLCPLPAMWVRQVLRRKD